MSNKYDFSKLPDWRFVCMTSFTIPNEFLLNSDFDVTLEKNDEFLIRTNYDQSKFSIIILNKLYYFKYDFNRRYTVETIINNSDLNKDHKNPLFREIQKIYNRNKEIDNLLK